MITIGEGIPSHTCLYANAHALARYAALCQEASIVPMIEPEVLLDGSHTVERCEEVTEATLRATYAAMAAHNVSLEHLILKTSMVVSGKECPRQANVDEVAERTLRVLKRTVPAAQPGIVFLSGGQSDEAATAHLNAMAAMKGLPWPLTFSYSRALQNPALEDLARPGVERHRGAEGLPPPRAHERPCGAGQVEARAGKAGRLEIGVRAEFFCMQLIRP